jgi:hypothetical protein
MFSNPVPNFPPIGFGNSHPGIVPGVADGNQPSSRVIPPVAINEIYQAAKNRAVEEHELDKLFNPEFYGENI